MFCFFSLAPASATATQEVLKINTIKCAVQDNLSPKFLLAVQRRKEYKGVLFCFLRSEYIKGAARISRWSTRLIKFGCRLPSPECQRAVHFANCCQNSSCGLFAPPEDTTKNAFCVFASPCKLWCCWEFPTKIFLVLKHWNEHSWIIGFLDF